MTSYDPATVRAMLVEAACTAQRAEPGNHDLIPDRIASRILAAHPAPATAPIAALHASAVERVMRAFDADQPVPVMPADHLRAEARRARFEAAVTEALAPTPTPAPSELHEHCVRMAVEAFDDCEAVVADRREHFVAAVRDRLAQSASIAACSLAVAKDAAELLSAAEWLDGDAGAWSMHSMSVGADWSASKRGSVIAHADGTAPTLRSAILAAARSLGWPGAER